MLPLHLQALYKGENAGSGNFAAVELKENIPAKHKFALGRFQRRGCNYYVRGFGWYSNKIYPAGRIDINTKYSACLKQFCFKRKTYQWHKPAISSWQTKTFNGFHRADGSVGTRNYWLVIPLVFCENKNVEVLQEAFMKALGYAPKQSPYEAMVQHMVQEYETGNTEYEMLFADEDEFELSNKKIFPNVDGIKFLKHTLGCGGTRDDARALCGLLAGYITHANVAGATVLSLGCQNAQIALLKEEIEKRDTNFSKPLFLLEQQKIGNEKQLLSEAIKKTFSGPGSG